MIDEASIGKRIKARRRARGLTLQDRSSFMAARCHGGPLPRRFVGQGKRPTRRVEFPDYDSMFPTEQLMGDESGMRSHVFAGGCFGRELSRRDPTCFAFLPHDHGATGSAVWVARLSSAGGSCPPRVLPPFLPF